MKWILSYYTNAETEYRGAFVVTDKVKRDDNGRAPTGTTGRAYVFFFALKGNSPVKVATHGRKFVPPRRITVVPTRYTAIRTHIYAHIHVLHNVTGICKKRIDWPARCVMEHRIRHQSMLFLVVIVFNAPFSLYTSCISVSSRWSRLRLVLFIIFM